MADVHSSEIRSKNMRAIRAQDTAIEQRIALLLKDRGFSFRVQDKNLPGRPDFVLTEHQAIILFMAASGIVITAICLNCRRRAQNSGPAKLTATLNVTGVMCASCRRAAGKC